jgi:hypothetical protein
MTEFPYRQCYVCGRIEGTDLTHEEIVARGEWEKLCFGLCDWCDYKNTLKIIPHALRQWGHKHDDYELDIGERVFYTLKLVCCLLLNRKRYFDYGEDTIDELIVWGEADGANQDGHWYSWQYATVGRGIFTNWHFNKGEDGS